MLDDFDVDINLQLCICGVVVVVPLPYPLLVHNRPFHLGIRNDKQVNQVPLEHNHKPSIPNLDGQKGWKTSHPKILRENSTTPL